MKQKAEVNSGVKIQPLGDRVLIRELTEQNVEKTTKSGIIIPVTAQDDKGPTRRGRVVAVGLGRYEEGKLIPVGVKTGDEVLYSWGDMIKLNGEEYTIVRENEVVAIIQ